MSSLAAGACFASASAGYDNATSDLFGDDDAAAAATLSEALYIVSMGTNDFLKNYYAMARAQAAEYSTAVAYGDYLLGVAESFVRELHVAGAGRSVDLNGLPLERATGSGGACTDEKNTVVERFNAGLQDMIARLNDELGDGEMIVYGDVYRPVAASGVRGGERDQFLVAGTDGVGTKLKLAFETGIHDTIGIDLVAMSVNDIVTSGAKPLFFLDYYATSKLDVDLAEKVIKGIVDGCQQSDCALLGGETAEMPDFYKEGEYDLSGFAVGAVKKDKVIDGKNIVEGDIIIGLPSSGVHSNGFSLARRVLEKSGLSLNDQLPRNDGMTTTVGEALMAPTVIYVKQVLEIISKGGVKGIAHITGGGFTDNIPRVFPSGLGAKIFTAAWEVPPVFRWIQEVGKIEDAEMRRTFNMGIGMVLVVSKEAADGILEGTHGPNHAYRIGEVISGEGVHYV
uniref:phosphoribosylformylglycinamidine cyclo-ligase n=1 Tax=Oryza barthii TaxID=65489 RepID=A0A0D3FQY7_9ORYZ